eukprot:464424-Prymnesium_polylepis.1
MCKRACNVLKREVLQCGSAASFQVHLPRSKRETQAARTLHVRGRRPRDRRCEGATHRTQVKHPFPRARAL